MIQPATLSVENVAKRALTKDSHYARISKILVEILRSQIENEVEIQGHFLCLVKAVACVPVKLLLTTF